MLENTESRVHTFGSKCFTHPETKEKVNVTSVCFTQKALMKKMPVLNGVWCVCGQQALYQQLGWASVSSE